MFVVDRRARIGQVNRSSIKDKNLGVREDQAEFSEPGLVQD